jgi:hypothetical protein
MISETNNQPEVLATQSHKSEKSQPDEPGSFHLEGFVKIYDPATQEVFLETRA